MIENAAVIVAGTSRTAACCLACLPFIVYLPQVIQFEGGHDL